MANREKYKCDWVWRVTDNEDKEVGYFKTQEEAVKALPNSGSRVARGLLCRSTNS